MRSELYQAAGSVLSYVASVGDTFVGQVQALADHLKKAAIQKGRGVECPYCQEYIRTVEDHAAFCDVAASLKTPLADTATAWPVVRYGIVVSRDLAEALTRKAEP